MPVHKAAYKDHRTLGTLADLNLQHGPCACGCMCVQIRCPMSMYMANSPIIKFCHFKRQTGPWPGGWARLVSHAGLLLINRNRTLSTPASYHSSSAQWAFQYRCRRIGQAAGGAWGTALRSGVNVCVCKSQAAGVSANLKLQPQGTMGMSKQLVAALWPLDLQSPECQPVPEPECIHIIEITKLHWDTKFYKQMCVYTCVCIKHICVCVCVKV